MVKQLLLFRFKKEVSRGEIEKFVSGYKKLVGVTPLAKVEIGENTSSEGFDQGYSFGAIASFEDKLAVEAFLVHPDHVQLADTLLNPLLDDFILVEIEV